MCINKRVVAVVALGTLALLVLAPRSLAGLAPLLVMAICPLSMMLMMRGTRGRRPEDSAAMTDGGGAQQRELEEEVNRLKAELALRDERRPA